MIAERARRGRLFLAVGVGVIFGSGWFLPNAAAHPAHAKPVNYPFVVGFERFYSSWDEDAYLARGGLILLNELNCVACHSPPEAMKGQLVGVEGTNLDGVGTRLDFLDLEIMIRNPRFVKKDTSMPSLFAGPDRDLTEVEAIKHYLASMTYEMPDYKRGDIEAGRQLYHRIGCVACHAPEVGFRPEGLPETAEIELAGLPSVPMNLADLYDLDALTHFLLRPNEHRPSGRMPDFQLSEKEASDVAAYLKAGPDLFLPDNVTEALTGNDEFELSATMAEKGKELFAAKNCIACHSIPGLEEKREPIARGLVELDAASREACLSARPVSGGVPFYGLDEVQKRAITEALKRLKDSEGALDLAEVDWRMKQLNCYACHERDGVGGVETAREVYFGFEQEDAIKLGRWGHLPPAIDAIGAKLTPEWMGRALLGRNGGSRVRPYMSGRMPVYGEAHVAPLMEELKRVDTIEAQPKRGVSVAPAKRGEALFGESGKNCIQCHSLGAQKSTEFPGIDLSFVTERLEWDYFFQVVSDPQSIHPGSPMPDQFEEPEASRDIQFLWKYLKSQAP